MRNIFPIVRGDSNKTWETYCGFLGLSIEEFMEIQEHLLLEQIDLMSQSSLGKKIMQGTNPRSLAEFRRLVPLTTYDDYAPYIGDCQENALPEKPLYWARTSGRGGKTKWVPYTKKAIDQVGKHGITMLILACASRRGEVRISNGFRIMHNLPPKPYYAGIGALAMVQQMPLRMIPPISGTEEGSFQQRIQDGFMMGLRVGTDMICSLTSVLVKMGERFSDSSGSMKISRSMLQPQIIARLLIAYLRSKRAGRAMLPKDLWKLKGLICYGMDTAIYREQLKHYWGGEPYEIYGATEAPLAALQAWNKKGMTFYPYTGFYEFAPEEEWLKSRENKGYQPRTVLLNELEPGKCYEVIITNFHGLPFMRYRIGDLIRVIGLEDNEIGISLPQVIFERRADDIIDIAGFTRLDEKTVWQAIANTGVRYEDWSARKEYDGDQPVIKIYMELKDSNNDQDLQRLLHTQLKAVSKDYTDLREMIGTQPLRVVIIPQGSFQRYYEEKRRAGVDLAHLKPAHINASDEDIEGLLYLMRDQKQEK